MNVVNRIKKFKFLILVLAAFTGIQFSCTEDFIGPVLKKARVETIVADFPANDGLSVDRSGNVYASNFSGYSGTQIFKVNPRTASVEAAVDSLVAPTGNVIDKNGSIYVANNIRKIAPDSGLLQGDIVRIDSDGTRTVLATLPGFPSGIAIDRKGNIFAANYYFPGVHKITPEGEVSVFVSDQRLLYCVGITFDEKGNLFVGNFNSGEILKINSDASIESLATLPTVVEGLVIGYITYFAGSIFATGIGENVIYRVSMSGEAKIFAGSGEKTTTDGNLMQASFDRPNGITADHLRKVLYITESGDSVSLRAIKFK
ncbi:hypothetical protein HME9304_02906 [Flagellimonas maritima]|uniref:Gluconolaconase n=1 Tax=Flagellimonas maritima TaxID=1383885 RepID=A0A2Z4LVN4_9FLAO|nr:hypothetical protein [Allomuricauda aurantiaca]AWX45876.1 hypothetical protein HME9304_02906 [Allomuricauda aurantiaca]